MEKKRINIQDNTLKKQRKNQLKFQLNLAFMSLKQNLNEELTILNL
jgi:hypothetical protein